MASTTIDGVIVKHIQFRTGDTWTVPAVEFTPPDAQRTTLVISDQGRTSTADAVLARLGQGFRVLAIDPFYFGESAIQSLDHLHALLMACVGERALGVQASQLAAISRWSTEEYGHPAEVIAYGPRVSAIATIAAALEENALATVELHNAYGSLKQIIEQNLTAENTPELFCFGLLEKFDLLQITALVAPRPVTFIGADERARLQMEPLQEWYARLGSDHIPLP